MAAKVFRAAVNYGAESQFERALIYWRRERVVNNRGDAVPLPQFGHARKVCDSHERIGRRLRENQFRVRSNRFRERFHTGLVNERAINSPMRQMLTHER